MRYPTRLTKKKFFQMGGLQHPKLFRKSTGRGWSYWYV